MPTNHEYFMELALEEATKALDEGNHPFGSLLVRDGEVLARGRNLAKTTTDLTAHAETMALRNAGAALHQIEFSGCTLYATFEPCPMCCGAIIIAHVSTLVLGGRLKRPGSAMGGYSVERLLELTQSSSQLTVVTGILQSQCEAIVEPWRQARTH